MILHIIAVARAQRLGRIRATGPTAADVRANRIGRVHQHDVQLARQAPVYSKAIVQQRHVEPCACAFPRAGRQSAPDRRRGHATRPALASSLALRCFELPFVAAHEHRGLVPFRRQATARSLTSGVLPVPPTIEFSRRKSSMDFCGINQRAIQDAGRVRSQARAAARPSASRFTEKRLANDNLGLEVVGIRGENRLMAAY